MLHVIIVTARTSLATELSTLLPLYRVQVKKDVRSSKKLKVDTLQKHKFPVWRYGIILLF